MATLYFLRMIGVPAVAGTFLFIQGGGTMRGTHYYIILYMDCLVDSKHILVSSLCRVGVKMYGKLSLMIMVFFKWAFKGALNGHP